MSPDDLNLWQQTSVNAVRLLNAYGPTEATITATAFELPARLGESTTFQRIPIGRPLANREIYILDSDGQPVPIGVPGELYIGGVGVARGYLNRPELTAEKFLPNPFSDEPGARLYKTGDLACYRPDGNIEFLGRTDHQVKIRGFRVELGEIEGMLRQHPLVREAVVLGREDLPGDERLVAYIVPTQQPGANSQQLRHFLQERVPYYMVPSAFVWMERLPLTPNGKVDRQALPAPGESKPELEKNFVGPRDELERQLTRVWEAVLNVKPIGVENNFFELGGHSLLALRLCRQMKRVVGKELPPALLFQAPTIARLARRLRQENGAPPTSILAIQPQGSKSPLFCVHGYDGYLPLVQHLGPEQPFYGLVQHLPGKRVRRTRVEEIAAHYLQEIQVLHPSEPYLLCGHSFGALVAFEMAQQLAQQGRPLGLLALFDPPPLTPSASPPVSSFGGVPISRPASLLGRLRPRGWLWGRLQHRFKQAVCIGCHLLDWPLPSSLSTFYVEEIVYNTLYAQAAHVYVPRRYAGRVTLFKPAHSEGRVQADWSAVAVGGVEVHEVPGTHLEMIQEPHVRTLVEKLQGCLARALEGT